MKSQILIKRYVQGFVNSVREDAEFSSLSRQIADFQSFLSAHKKVKDVLTSPFLPSAKKVDVARELLARIPLNGKVSRFILLLVEKSRLDLLPGILESLPEMWNTKKGILTFEVSSAVPLPDPQKKKMEEEMARFAGGPVALKFKVDASLIGGLSLKRGNIIYDISVKGSLSRIKEKIGKE